MKQFETDARVRAHEYEIEPCLIREDDPTKRHTVKDAVEAHAVWLVTNNMTLDGQFAETVLSGGRAGRRQTPFDKPWLSFRGAFLPLGRVAFNPEEKEQLLYSLADHLASTFGQIEVFITFEGNTTIRCAAA